MIIRQTSSFNSTNHNYSEHELIERYENEKTIRLIKSRIRNMDERRNIIHRQLDDDIFLDDTIMLYKIDSNLSIIFIVVDCSCPFKIHVKFAYDGQEFIYGFYMDLKSCNVTYDACELSSIIKDHKQDMCNQISEICGNALPHISLFITNRKKFCDEHRIQQIFNLLLS